MTPKVECTRCECVPCQVTRLFLVFWRMLVGAGLVAVLVDHLLP